MTDSWYATATTAFRAHLSEFGLTFPAEQGEQLIRDRVEALASMLRVSGRTAQTYLDPVLLAASVAASFEDERPGEDMLSLPRDVGIPVPMLGRCVAGLAEAITVRLAHDPPGEVVERVANLAGPISALGQMMAALEDDMSAGPTDGPDRRGAWEVPVPRALVHRIIRSLDTTARILDDAGMAPGELASDGRDGALRLAATFRSDADMLRVLAGVRDNPPVWPPQA